MQILVVNSGSSSIKFSVFEVAGGSPSPAIKLDGELRGASDSKTTLRVKRTGDEKRGRLFDFKIEDTAQAMGVVFDALKSAGMPAMDAVGYRVVHPGPRLKEHQRITPGVLDELKKAEDFAPLHNPAAVAVICEGMKRLVDVPHYACFDTVFHLTMPEEAFSYAIPEDFREQGVRRYGFHGISCESIMRSMREEGMALPSRMVIAHLGSGCSITAVIDGFSIDTTMGLTPTGGVVMGTRPGDLDPGLLLYMLRHQEGRADAIDNLESILNYRSGMVGLSGLRNDMRQIREAALGADSRASNALKVFTRSITKAIGSYCWLMGGLDAIVFAGGIGENDGQSRKEILTGLEELGVVLDSELNEMKSDDLRRISATHSKVAVFIVPSQEDLMIAIHVMQMALSAS
jgi:acetate kinase